MTRILLCYQNGDGETLTQRLLDSLRGAFGVRTVTDIQEGQGLKDIKNGETLVVVIGREWTTNSPELAGRSLRASDSLRRLIASALLNPNVFVIPVLLNNTPRPRSADLPIELQKLAQHDMLPCRDEIYDRDMDRIIHAIRVRNAPRASSQRILVFAGLLLVLAVIAGVVMFYRSDTFKTIAADFDATLERLDPARLDAYREQGWANYDAGNYTESISYFKRVISLVVNDTGAISGLGWSYYYLHEYDVAERYFDREVELAPLALDSYKDRGRFFQSIGNAEKAIPDFEKVTEGRPLDGESFMALAQSYDQVGDYQKSIVTYQAILNNIDGRSAAAYYGMGKANDQLKRYKQALDAFQHYIELEPNPEAAILQRVEELKTIVAP